MLALPRDQPSLRLRLFGGFSAEVGGCPLLPTAWRLRKARQLVALLALAPGHRLPREQVMDALWPTLDPEAAANNLRVTLHGVRRVLAPAGLVSQGDLLRLNPAASVATDVAAFETAVAVARRKRDPAAGWAATDLYTGDLLPEDAYEDWVAGRRDGLRQAYLGLLTDLARWEEARGERAAAIAALERLVAVEPAEEAAQRGLMRLLAETGHRHRALRQYERLREVLRDELDTEPEAATRNLYQTIVSGAWAPALPPPPPEPDRPTGNLPLALTSFIGRTAELIETRRLLGETRLLTLTGTGGTGKTRLALELARAVAPDYPDGVWLVELAALVDPALVPVTVAQALGAAEQVGRPPREALVAWLRGRRGLLLVLDNCEHLVDACAILTEAVLRACAGVRILATSRRPLAATGEVAWALPPLTVPVGTPDGQATWVARAEAPQLFVARAAAARPGFVLNQTNVEAVAAICARLDGLPLAIELAAARTRALTPSEIAARLDDRFALLTGGDPAGPARHRSLRAALDWSHALLEPAARVVFQRLGAFAGDFDLTAAEAVATGEGVERTAVLDALVALVDAALVEAEPAGVTMRYRLLETVAAYARERLAEAGDGEAARARHLAHFLALAGAAEPHLWGGPAQATWLDRLTAEHDNLRAALAWAIGHDPAASLALAARLWPFWQRRVHLTEGRNWLERALAQAGDNSALRRDRARSLLGAGTLARLAGDFPVGRARLEAALTMGRTQGDTLTQARAAADLGHLLSFVSQHAAAAARLEEALALSRAVDDAHSLAVALKVLSGVARRAGDHPVAVHLLEEAVVAARQTGDAWELSAVLHLLGLGRLKAGNPAAATAVLAEGWAVARRVGAEYLAMRPEQGLAQVAYWRGDLSAAAAAFADLVARARARGDEQGLAWNLGWLGRTLRLMGETDRAAAALMEAQTHYAVLGLAWGVALTMNALGWLALERGDLDQATTLLTESLARYRAINDLRWMPECLEGLAVAAVKANQAEQAARLLGAAAALRATGEPLPLSERPAVDAAEAAARAVLGEATFAAAWATGQMKRLEVV